MTDAVIVGDIHLSDKSPLNRTDAYTSQILDKLNFAAGVALSAEVPLVLAGDVFHFKAPTANSHKLVQATHEALAGVRTFIVPGNHDLSGDRLDTLPKQPLGALSRMKNVSLLMGVDEELPGIAGIPYLTEFDGGDWHPVLDAWLDKCVSIPPDLVVTHAPIFPPGQEPGVYYSIDPYEWVERMNLADVYNTYYGHIHDCHGEFEVENHTFCNQGALSRGSLHESSVTRKPAVTLWSGGEFIRIEVPHLPPKEVFLMAQVESKAANKASALEFADALGSAKFASLTLENVYARLNEKIIEKPVRDAVTELLEDAQ